MPIDAEEFYGKATQFSLAAQLLPNNNADVGVPIVVCLAFAAEAYLKSLLMIEERRFEKIHNLRKLFGAVSKESRAIIERQWNDICLPNGPGPVGAGAPGAPPGYVAARSLNQALEQSADAFLEWRYGGEAGLFYWSVGPLPELVRDRILNLKPAWRQVPPDAYGVRYPKGQR